MIKLKWHVKESDVAGCSEASGGGGNWRQQAQCACGPRYETVMATGEGGEETVQGSLHCAGWSWWEEFSPWPQDETSFSPVSARCYSNNREVGRGTQL